MTSRIAQNLNAVKSSPTWLKGFDSHKATLHVSRRDVQGHGELAPYVWMEDETEFFFLQVTKGKNITTILDKKLYQNADFTEVHLCLHPPSVGSRGMRLSEIYSYTLFSGKSRK